MSSRNAMNFTLSSKDRDSDALVKEILEAKNLMIKYNSYIHMMWLEELDMWEDVLQALLDLLRACSWQAHQAQADKEKGLNILVIAHCPSNPFLDVFVESLMILDTPRKIEMIGADSLEDLEVQRERILEQQQSNERDEDDDTNHEEDPSSNTALFPLETFGFRMKFAGRLQALGMHRLLLTKDHIESLMFGMQTSSGSGCRITSLRLERVMFLDDADEVMQELCNGMQENSALESLAINHCDDITDDQLSSLLLSLARHPTLTKIFLEGTKCRKKGMDALDAILVDNGKCESEEKFLQLESLILDCQCSFGERLPIETMVKGRAHQSACYYESLQRLDLSGNQIHDADMETIVLLIQRFPNLEELQLNNNEIKMNGLQLFVEITRSLLEEENGFKRSRLRTLDLHGNALSDGATRQFRDILELYPMMREIKSYVDWANTDDKDKIQHLLDINSAGRILLQQQSHTNVASNNISGQEEERRIPMSVWPTVLARLTPKMKKSKYERNPKDALSAANGLYYLIRHGPIFAGKTEDRKRAAAASPDGKSSGTGNHKKRKPDPALGGYATLDEFLNSI